MEVLSLKEVRRNTNWNKKLETFPLSWDRKQSPKGKIMEAVIP